MLDEIRNELKDLIRKRTEDHVGDWTPFVNNIEDILSEIKGIGLRLWRMLRI